MKEVITVNTLDNTTITIFTKHITHIEHAAKGCIVYVDCGGEHAAIATGLSWPEFINVLALK